MTQSRFSLQNCRRNIELLQINFISGSKLRRILELLQLIRKEIKYPSPPSVLYWNTFLLARWRYPGTRYQTSSSDTQENYSTAPHFPTVLADTHEIRTICVGNLTYGKMGYFTDLFQDNNISHHEEIITFNLIHFKL